MKFVLPFAIIALLLGCQSNLPDESNVFFYNENNSITTLDPAFARDLEIMWATNQLFDGLVEFDKDLNLIPCIAKSWKVSEDGRAYTFNLRKNVRFHPSPLFSNPEERYVTAQDFVYSFRRIVDPILASPGAWIFDKVNDPLENGFQAPNDTTLIIQLKEPFHPFLSILTMQYCNVVPKEVVEHFGPDFRSNPIGTGPFKFAFWYEGTSLVFHKHISYWQTDSSGITLPYLDGIKIDFIKDVAVEYQNFLLGNYDFISGIHPAYKDELLTPKGELNAQFESKINFYKTPFIKTDYLGFYLGENTSASTMKALQDVRIRKAIELSINKEEMVRYLKNNTVVAANQGFIPPALLHSPQLHNEYNPQKAQDLLTEAGFPKGQGLPEIPLAATADYADLLEYMQHQLALNGIKISINILQGPTLREASAKGTLPVFRKSWLADYPDAENFTGLFLKKNFSPDGPNYTHFYNENIEVLYAKSNSGLPDSSRLECFAAINELVASEVPVIPLYYDQVTHFVSPKIMDWEINPINMIDLKKVKKIH